MEGRRIPLFCGSSIHGVKTGYGLWGRGSDPARKYWKHHKERIFRPVTTTMNAGHHKLMEVADNDDKKNKRREQSGATPQHSSQVLVSVSTLGAHRVCRGTARSLFGGPPGPLSSPVG